MNALYTINEFKQAVKGECIGKPTGAIMGISIDSRTIQKNDVFWAIEGERFDGHDFVDHAIQAGACMAVVSRQYASDYPKKKASLYIVDDTLAALKQLAQYARQRTRANVIAITGSLGKTTTKEMIRQLLLPSGRVHAAPSSYNNHIGVPLTLVNMPTMCDYAVFEIGTNHPGEIEPLAQLVAPDIAVLTCIEPVHIGNFKSMNDLALEKTTLFLGMKDQGFAVVNGNNEYIPLIREQVIKSHIGGFFRYGSSSFDEVRILDVGENAESLSLDIAIMGEQYSLYLPTTARYLVNSALAAIAVVYLTGASIEKAIEVLARFKTLEGRGNIKNIVRNEKQFTIMDDSYNASPVSMHNGLQHFNRLAVRAKRRVLVLGEMLELGKDSKRYHVGLSKIINDCNPHKVFLVGQHMLSLWQMIETENQGCFSNDWKEILVELDNYIDNGDYIFIKGSNGSGVHHIAKALYSKD